MKVTVEIDKRRATLTLEDDKGVVVDRDEWTLDGLPKRDRKRLPREVFDDCYDALNFAVHGYPTTE